MKRSIKKRFVAVFSAIVMAATMMVTSASAATNESSGRMTVDGTKGLSRLEWQVNYYSFSGSNSVTVLGLFYNLTGSSRYCQVSMSAEYGSTTLASGSTGGTASSTNAPPFTAPFNKTISNKEYVVKIFPFLYNGSSTITGILSSASSQYYVYRK